MRVLGLMSGTSVDGVDAAVAEFEPDGEALRLRTVGAATFDWPTELRDRVLAALPPHKGNAVGPDEICRLDHDLGVELGSVATRAIKQLSPPGVDLVASHGQTIYHDVRPDGVVGGTLQIGQPAEIAERTGLPVVADFRVRDVAAGGQGAPLVSMVDQLLLGGTTEPAGLVNLGGIANITALRPGHPTLAFDCGPANALLDLAVQRTTGEPFDVDGARTARGHVHPGLLAALVDDEYFSAPPPKSTGKERFDAAYLDRALSSAPVDSVDDQLATLAEGVAAVVAEDVRRLGIARVWASGGGMRNAGLVSALRRRLDAAGATLASSDELGLPADDKEAYAFALLGWLTWHGLPASLPSCTGAAGPRVLGAIVPGAAPLQLPAPVAAMPSRLVVS